MEENGKSLSEGGTARGAYSPYHNITPSTLNVTHTHHTYLCAQHMTPMDPMRHMSPFSTTSSNEDGPGRCVYLHTLLSTLRHSDAVSEVDVAISRELK